ncbi:hatching enzyme-like [Adelges cooleyi]|uniref:hatching enzyme-like n=1 Tax=Adelges cooleyi TaxID=133065 RepID=UPI0021803C09|nr:hatching enzyme-like [Adelges cooleyi]
MCANKNCVLILSSALLLFNGLGHAAVEIKNSTQAIKYLTQFGYYSPITLDPNSIHLLEKESLRNALLDFQSFAGISETGVLDQETLELMNTPRCGCLDRFYRTRPKRYGHLLETWRVDNLTYKISKYPSKQLSKEQTDLEFRKAFDVWSEVMPIVFHERDAGLVRIEILFANGEHGDFIPFDGPSGVIVHNLSPSRGSVHFDDAEIWTVGIRKGINLFQVALHVIGHVLGLDHSLDANAVMRPFYKSYNPNVELHNDDILGVQEMYGPRVELEDNDDDDDRISILTVRTVYTYARILESTLYSIRYQTKRSCSKVTTIGVYRQNESYTVTRSSSIRPGRVCPSQ